jgi:hypothetical protein
MDKLAEDFAARGVGGFFLYTHEAHPGERYPHHESMEQKQRQALGLRAEYGITRPILLDALDGACHRAYGCMPNMTYIFDKRGTVMYKAQWTSADSVRAALEQLLSGMQRRKDGEPLAQFEVQRVEYRHVDRPAFFEGLKRAGPRAVAEFTRESGIKPPG